MDGANSSHRAADEGWTRRKAEAELRHVLADVERGLCAPGVDRTAEAPKSPTFHEFASAWLAARRGELREARSADYTWQLCNHLLPFFHAHRLPQISVAEVDRYREFKAPRAGPLANELLARRGETPLPEGVSAHKLRHTFASILFVRGEEPPYAIGHH